MSQFMPTHAESMATVSPTTARLFGPGGIFHPTTGPAPAAPGTPTTPGTPAAPVGPAHPLLTKIWTLIQQGQAAGFPKIKSLIGLLITSGILGTQGSGFLSTLLGILNGLSGTASVPTAQMQTSASLLGAIPLTLDWAKFEGLLATVTDPDDRAALEWLKQQLA